MSDPMTPEERAESLRLAIQMQIKPVESEGAGHYWMLSDDGFLRIAAAIQQAEDDALERAAQACDAIQQEALVARSSLIGPEFFETKTQVARQLAEAIRGLKHRSSSE